MTATHNTPRHTEADSERPRSHKRSPRNGRALTIERRSQRALKHGGYIG